MRVQENPVPREWDIPQIQRSAGEGAVGREAARPVVGPRRLHQTQGGGSAIVWVLSPAYSRSSPARFRLILLF
jgi:hypothetical protein